jgi:hypothetical protein
MRHHGRSAETCDGKTRHPQVGRSVGADMQTANNMRLGEGYTASNVTQHAQHADAVVTPTTCR